MAPSIAGNVNKGFLKVYPYFGYFAAILVITLFIISFIDMISFATTEISQNIAVATNQNLLNRDTMETVMLKLAKNSNTTTAYNIFLQQRLVTFMGKFFSIIILWLVIHVTVYFLLIMFENYNAGKKCTTDVSANNAPVESENAQANHVQSMVIAFFSIIVMIGVASVYSSLFGSFFQKDVQPDIIQLSKTIKDLTEVIYDNMTTDEAFLKNLVGNNMSECYKIIVKQGNRTDKIGSMIFTISLFDYYKQHADKSFIEKIKPMFTVSQIRLRSVDPFSYLYYNQKAFISSAFEYTASHIKKVVDTETKRDAIRRDVKNRLNDVNRKFANMFEMASIRNNLRMYMFVCTLVAFTFSILICIIYGKQISEFVTASNLQMAWEAVKDMFSSGATGFKDCFRWPAAN
jgi:hypothetical protein